MRLISSLQPTMPTMPTMSGHLDESDEEQKQFTGHIQRCGTDWDVSILQWRDIFECIKEMPLDQQFVLGCNSFVTHSAAIDSTFLCY